MEYTDIRYSDITTCIDSVSARAAQTGGRMVSKWIVWGRAVSCLHNQAPNLNTIDSLWWNTLTSGTVTLLRVLILWVPELENWGRMVSKWIVWGRAVSCLHNQAPNLNTIDFLWWNTLTSGTVTLLRVLILWVPEQAQLGDGWSSNELCEGEQSHAYIIKHPISTQLTSCDGIHSHQVSDITTCIDSVSARAGELGRMVSKWIVWGRALSCLHNQAPNLNTIDFLPMEYTDIRYSDITTCIDSVSARAAQLEDGWSPNELYEGEQSHAYIIKHPIETQLTLAMEYTDIRYSDITTCIDSVSARAGELGTDSLQMNCVRESSLMLTYQAPNWNTIELLVLIWHSQNQYT